jgi:hypothetical protein
MRLATAPNGAARRVRNLYNTCATLRRTAPLDRGAPTALAFPRLGPRIGGARSILMADLNRISLTGGAPPPARPAVSQAAIGSTV